MDMTPPTQSPATAAAEALRTKFNIGGAPVYASIQEIAGVIQSAYASTEQELKEARSILEELVGLVEGHRIDKEDIDCFTVQPAQIFLSKNSNLPRE